MSFRVELWDRHALHIRWVIAAAGSVFLARAAFDEAVKQWPDQKLTLRQGMLLISEHPDPRANPRQTYPEREKNILHVACRIDESKKS
jgi:hypothetical protein